MKVIKTQNLPEIGVSHNTEIKKKVFIHRNEIPNIMMFGSATFLPGESVETYKHDTMYEVFYIQSGKVDFIVEGKKMTLEAGDCITIEEGEYHAQSNAYQEKVTWLYFGVATDQ